VCSIQVSSALSSYLPFAPLRKEGVGLLASVWAWLYFDVAVFAPRMTAKLATGAIVKARVQHEEVNGAVLRAYQTVPSRFEGAIERIG
jgi:hypothetical protein